MSKNERQNFLAALALASIGLLTALSLIPTGDSPNLLGNFGSQLGFYLLLSLGLSAWLLPAVLLRFSWGFFRGEPVTKPGLKVLGVVFIGSSLDSLLEILIPNTPMKDGVSWGGELGRFIGVPMQASFGTFGSIVVCLLVVVLASWLLEKEGHLIKSFQWLGLRLKTLAIKGSALFMKLAEQFSKSMSKAYTDWQTNRSARKTAEDARRKLSLGQKPGSSPAQKPVSIQTPTNASEPHAPRIGAALPTSMENATTERSKSRLSSKPVGEGNASVWDGTNKIPANIELEPNGVIPDESKKVHRIVRNWNLPSVNILKAKEEALQAEADDYEAVSRTLMETLRNFGVDATVAGANPGPTVTQYEIQLAAGVKISDVVSLSNDLALALQVATVRVAPIAGKAFVGVEVPNRKGRIVTMKELLADEGFANHTNKLRVALGREIAGGAIYCNLNEMPHLLIAGATGSGKSVCVNTLIASILFRSTPEEVRFMLIDPKRVEMTVYQGLPHLAIPVVNDPKEAHRALKWLVEVMEERYKKLAHLGVRDIDGFNAKVLARRASAEADDETLYYIVVLIDELADLMMVAKDQVEDAIARLAQMARAVGIHLVLATQRPSVEVITGTIKANFPSRIAFQVFSKTDSRTVLDSNGAEALLGRGDMLYLPSGSPKPLRLQGAYVTLEEIERLTDFWKSQGAPHYAVDLSAELARELVSSDSEDELYDEAVQAVVLAKQASTSLLQRRLKIGYGRAARLLDDMEKRGMVGPPDGNKPRRVLVKSLGEIPGGGAFTERPNEEAENDETDR